MSAESGVPTFRGAGGYWRKWQAQVSKASRIPKALLNEALTEFDSASTKKRAGTALEMGGVTVLSPWFRCQHALYLC